MLRVGVVTDSIACLTRELVDQYSISILPINIYAGGRVYRDWVDITPAEAYRLFLADPDSFKTSAVSPGDCLQIFRELCAQGKDIFCVTLSAKLSTTCHVVRMVADQVKDEFPQISMDVLDSQTATAAEGFTALAAARAAEEDKSLDEVSAAARRVKDRVWLIALMETMRYVYRTGRIPKLAARLGSALSLRPVFTFAAGAPHLVRVVRDKQSGIRHILRFLREKIGDNPVHVAVMHAYAPEEAETLKQQVAAQFNCVELWLTEFSPVMGYACGTGTLGLAFYQED
ncbi:MAG: DegV family protein [Chloroflexi bacterium]|nr:DegV family protein [Chloroflexota bacterium]